MAKKEKESKAATVSEAIESAIATETPTQGEDQAQAESVIDAALQAQAPVATESPVSESLPSETPRRGRPPGSKTKKSKASKAATEEAPAEPVNMPEFIASVGVGLSATFLGGSRALAGLRGIPEWELSESSAASLGTVWAPILAPLLAKYPMSVTWATALSVTYAVLSPGIKAEMQRAKEARKAKADNVPVS